LRDASAQRRFEELLPRVRRPARLIGGEVGSSPGFTGAPAELRVVVGFPDTYEIGISNQALQILYHLADRTEGVAVERTYLPWVDVITEMRRENIPLLTLETWSPVVSADLLGLTLQHESNFTSLLEMLDLAGIPVRAGDRDKSHPLVVVGGPACANFFPVAPFVDAVAVGDGEEVFVEMLESLAQAKLEGAGRDERKLRLSGLQGVFVPGLSSSVSRRCMPRLEEAPYPEACLVPLTEGVHDRAWVEVMRGCTRGCRFCQAGMWYRPVRERSPGRVLAMTGRQLRATGYEEVAFASLSTTDYSCLQSVLTGAAACYPEVQVSLPSLRVDSAAVRLAGLASPTGPSLTLAPEAGSQRMRDIINKNVTEPDILGAVEEAVRAGKTTLKLYFMIGLPWEEDADALAIADLCVRIRDVARGLLGSRAGRLQLNVSVNNFVPKPFTAFQWTAVADRETLRRRQGLIRDRLRRPGVRTAFSRVEVSYLEAALARGGEDMADIIERAWTLGARLDSWSEEFRGEAWSAAFAAAGTSAEELATVALDSSEPLPWDVIKGAVDRGFLRSEWERAARGELTPDCRWDRCSDCGVCGGALANDLAAEAGAPGPAPGLVAAEPVRAAAPSAAAEPAEPVGPAAAQRHRYAATFSVTGRGRFLGHLDRAEVFRRAVRRAGGRLALSAGMRPKALLSLALPLAVGVEGSRELAEFELAEAAEAGFAERLAACLPEHLSLLDLQGYEGRRSLAARVVGASYEATVRATEGTGDVYGKVHAACRRFAESVRLPVEEEHKGKTRQVDVREYVDRVQVADKGEGSLVLAFQTKVSPAGAARPQRVVEAVAALSDCELALVGVTRTAIHLSKED
jgi:radical SAM-linked protein